MGMVFLLTGLACVLFAVGIALLLWMVHAGQLDDLETPAQRMLGDDPPVPPIAPKPALAPTSKE